MRQERWNLPSVFSVDCAGIERSPGQHLGSRRQRGSLCWESGKRFAEEFSDELGLGEGGVCRLKAEGTARQKAGVDRGVVIWHWW